MGLPPGGNIQALAAATKSQNGAILAALDAGGQLWLNGQDGPGGSWGRWVLARDAMGQPVPGQDLAFSGQGYGPVTLAMTDLKGMVWILAQDGGGGWNDWVGPGIGGELFSFGAIAASEQGGGRGVQLAAADDTGGLWGCEQPTLRGPWGSWTSGFGDLSGGSAFPIGEVAVAGQNNACLMLVAESGGVLSAVPQTSPGGGWGEASALNPNGPSVNRICASQQSGARGVQVWGIDTSEERIGQIWTIFQDSAGGPWDPWAGPGFLNQPEPLIRIAAAGQGNGCVMLFGVGITGNLWTIGQTSPGGSWGGWAQMTAPPAAAAEAEAPKAPAAPTQLRVGGDCD